MFDHCIYYNLSTLSRQITKIWNDEFALIGLAPSQGYLLAALERNENASQKDLSDLMELDASTVTRFMNVLVTKGFIEKDRNGKGASYTLTLHGKKTAKDINRIMDSLFVNMQNIFGKQNFSQIVGNLQQTKQTLKEVSS